MFNLKKINRKYWFYISQIFIFIFSIFFIWRAFLDTININIYSWLISIRNTVISDINNSFFENKNKITIVWIDQEFFNKENISFQWLHRWYYAKAIENILYYEPYVLWVDVLFEKKYKFSGEDERSKMLTEIYSSYDEELIENLSDKIILGATYNDSSWEFVKPDDSLLSNWADIWHVHSKIFKSYDLWIYSRKFEKNNDSYLDSFPAKIYQNYEYNKLNSILSQWEAVKNEIKSTNDFYSIWNINIPKVNMKWEDFLFTPIYELNHNNFNYLSLYDVYHNKENLSEYFKDKIVIIWAVDPALQDIKPSIIWQIAGVVFHSNQILSFLNKDFIYIFNSKEIQIIVFFILLINTLIFFVFKFNWSQKFIFFLMISEIILFFILTIIFSILWFYNNWFSIFLPLWSIYFVIFIQLSFTSMYYITEINFIKNNFKKLFWLYVWKNVSESGDWYSKVWEKKVKKSKISMYFSDIEWFTNISEKLNPEQNMAFLNIYLEKMSENISINKWFIDKYIWDAVMAFWENDDKSYLAVKSAVLNIISIKEINALVKEQINVDINLNTRIWLHYGEAVIWDLWSDKYKLNYTIIWDNVNLAARLESINKFYGTNICASWELIDNIKNKSDFIYRKLDIIQVKWKEKSVILYEIFPKFNSLISSTEKEELNNFIFYFETWLELYIKWDFDNALSNFKNAKQIKNDKSCEIFIERCEILLKNTPDNWNWVWKHTSK